MGDNNLTSGVDGNVISASIVNQYKTALSGDLIPRASDGAINDEVSSIGRDTNRFKDLHMHGVPYNKGAKLLPAGLMMQWPFSTEPTDWLFCDKKTIGQTGSGADYEGDYYRDLYDNLKAEALLNNGAWDNGIGDQVWGDDDLIYLPKLDDGRFVRNTGGDAATIGVPQASANLSHDHLERMRDTTGTVRPLVDSSTTGTQDICFNTATQAGGGSGIHTANDGGSESRPINVAVNYLIRI